MNKMIAIALIACSNLFVQPSFAVVAAVTAPTFIALQSKQNNPVASKQTVICLYQIPGHQKYVNLYNLNSITAYEDEVLLQLLGNSVYVKKTKTLTVDQIMKSLFVRLEQCKKENI